MPVAGSAVHMIIAGQLLAVGSSRKSARPELADLSSSPSSATYGLCDLGQVAQHP